MTVLSESVSTFDSKVSISLLKDSRLPRRENHRSEEESSTSPNIYCFYDDNALELQTSFAAFDALWYCCSAEKGCSCEYSNSLLNRLMQRMRSHKEREERDSISRVYPLSLCFSDQDKTLRIPADCFALLLLLLVNLRLRLALIRISLSWLLGSLVLTLYPTDRSWEALPL